jgi:hypothetical protein
METPEFLTVTSFGEVKKDSNQRIYKQVFLKGNDLKDVIIGGKVSTIRMEARESSIIVRESRYLDDKPDFGWDFKIGERVGGAIVTREVMPYEITDAKTGEVRTVSTYTRPVLGDTTNKAAFEAAVRREFNSQGHPLLEDVTREVQSLQQVGE